MPSSASDMNDICFGSARSGTKVLSFSSPESRESKASLAMAPTCCCNCSTALLILVPPTASGELPPLLLAPALLRLDGVSSSAKPAAVLFLLGLAVAALISTRGLSTSLLISSSKALRLVSSAPIPSSVYTEFMDVFRWSDGVVVVVILPEWWTGTSPPPCSSFGPITPLAPVSSTLVVPTTPSMSVVHPSTSCWWTSRVSGDKHMLPSLIAGASSSSSTSSFFGSAIHVEVVASTRPSITALCTILVAGDKKGSPADDESLKPASRLRLSPSAIGKVSADSLHAPQPPGSAPSPIVSSLPSTWLVSSSSTSPASAQTLTSSFCAAESTVGGSGTGSGIATSSAIDVSAPTSSAVSVTRAPLHSSSSVLTPSPLSLLPSLDKR
mmetsp:Transcript_28317/g.66437  ORF Transcript_28317/g.66437 Transcript_28317/m.66437 type:complete len:383 (-) Transcript_28317:460-1608(-)